jgi:hypothetical protein
VAKTGNNEGIIQHGGTINVGGAFAVGRNARAISNAPAPLPEMPSPSAIEHQEALEAPSVYSLEWDAFVSHASEDKDFVEPLVRTLMGRGLKIWYDSVSLRVGNSLRETIDFGLVKSRFGIVVLSPHYFAKDWTRQEVNGMFSREIGGVRVVLLIWHHVTFTEVSRFSPILADRVAVRSSEGLDVVAEKLSRSIKPTGKAT